MYYALLRLDEAEKQGGAEGARKALRQPLHPGVPVIYPVEEVKPKMVHLRPPLALWLQMLKWRQTLLGTTGRHLTYDGGKLALLLSNYGLRQLHEEPADEIAEFLLMHFASEVAAGLRPGRPRIKAA